MTRKEMELAGKKEATFSGEPTKSDKHFIPAVDIYETETEVSVIAEMPGVGKDGVDICLENGTLTIGGKVADAVTAGAALLTEYETGNFTRKFSVAESIDQEKIRAAMKDGVLTLTLPKTEPARPRKIAVVAE